MPPGHTIDGEPVVGLGLPAGLRHAPGPVVHVPRPSRAPDDLTRDDLARNDPAARVLAPNDPAPPDVIAPPLRCGLLTAPTETWTADLDATQAAAVRVRLDGPGLIRGVVGTGTSVVGLHRAIHLARAQPGRVLLTALAPALTTVLRRHADRLAPDVAERIDCLALPSVAARILRERGVRLDLNPLRVADALDEAWRTVGRRGLLAHLAPDRAYWEQEIAVVLRAQGVRSLAEYLDLPRTGRRHRLGPNAREAVWALHEATVAALRRREVHTPGDVAQLAEAELRRAPLDEPWAAVLVDDAQELSATMLRVVRLLAPGGGAGGAPPTDVPDALTLLGDARLPLHPGGSTLAEAGIDVSDRTLTLRLNQRSTVPILSLAGGLYPGGDAPTLAGPPEGGPLPRTAPRAGTEPVVVRCGDDDAARAAAVDHLRTLLGSPSAASLRTRPVAVLLGTHRDARGMVDALAAAGLPALLLDEHDGVPADAVLVGTVQRAAGLEFAQVLLPRVPAALLDDDPPDDDLVRERWDLDRRELVHAITRARDGLWMGVVEG